MEDWLGVPGAAVTSKNLVSGLDLWAEESHLDPTAFTTVNLGLTGLKTTFGTLSLPDAGHMVLLRSKR